MRQLNKYHKYGSAPNLIMAGKSRTFNHTNGQPEHPKRVNPERSTHRRLSRQPQSLTEMNKMTIN
jgi:hypothetical protein